MHWPRRRRARRRHDRHRRPLHRLAATGAGTAAPGRSGCRKRSAVAGRGRLCRWRSGRRPHRIGAGAAAGHPQWPSLRRGALARTETEPAGHRAKPARSAVPTAVARGSASSDSPRTGDAGAGWRPGAALISLCRRSAQAPQAWSRHFPRKVVGPPLRGLSRPAKSPDNSIDRGRSTPLQASSNRNDPQPRQIGEVAGIAGQDGIAVFDGLDGDPGSL